ncbi:hypothetical protein BZG36_00319 [Bifiguratus adelaidae]|uniref:Protein SMG9 n=1 Tax=Bifiguratus adelaidae TaxID=1938954 RepID=A0A261Y7L8_9FUNG|nr:hypothetical protein BZG36_00319 [Bifiguratus adelaidae]
MAAKELIHNLDNREDAKPVVLTKEKEKSILQPPKILSRAEDAPKTSVLQKHVETKSTEQHVNKQREHKSQDRKKVGIDRGTARLFSEAKQGLQKTTSDLSTQTAQLVTKSGKIQADVAYKMLHDTPGHFVIGVIGKRGVGKSTLLSAFADQPQSSTNDAREGFSLIISGRREQFHRADAIEQQSISIGLFLYSVCNVLLVVSKGGKPDAALSRFLRRCEMLKYGLPDVASAGTIGEPTGEEYYPEIVFVCNECDLDDYASQCFQRTRDSIITSMRGTRLRMSGKIHHGDISRKSDGQVVECMELKPNFFFLPRMTAREKQLIYSPNSEQVGTQSDSKTRLDILSEVDEDDIYNGIDTYENMARELRTLCLSLGKRGGGKDRLSERDWLRAAVRTWDGLTKQYSIVQSYLSRNNHRTFDPS